MPRYIAIITTNVDLKKRVQRVFDHLDVHEIYLQTIEDKHQGQEDYDLVVLDGLQIKSESDVGILRAKRGFSKASFLILASGEEPKSLKGVDGVLPASSFDELRNIQLLLRLLYKRVSGVRERWHGTELVWKLMESRSAAILRGEFVRFNPELIDLTDARAYDADTTLVSSEFFKSLKDSSFVSLVAQRLYIELRDLFWIAVTSMLVETSECRLASFGLFKKEFQGNQLDISFMPDVALARVKLPEIEFHERTLDNLTLEALQLCAQNIVLPLYAMTTNQDLQKIPLLDWFQWTLQGICDELKNDGKTSWEELSGLAKPPIHGWFGKLIKASAYSVYFMFTVSVAWELRLGKTIHIPAIGSLSLGPNGTKIDFSLAAELKGLIESNPMALGIGH